MDTQGPIAFIAFIGPTDFNINCVSMCTKKEDSTASGPLDSYKDKFQRRTKILYFTADIPQSEDLNSTLNFAVEASKTARFTKLLRNAAKAYAACALPPDPPPPEAEPQSLA